MGIGDSRAPCLVGARLIKRNAIEVLLSLNAGAGSNVATVTAVETNVVNAWMITSSGPTDAGFSGTTELTIVVMERKHGATSKNSSMQQSGTSVL